MQPAAAAWVEGWGAMERCSLPAPACLLLHQQPARTACCLPASCPLPGTLPICIRLHLLQGVTLTHSNLLYQVDNLSHFLPVGPGESALSLLPPWHIYERSCGWGAGGAGGGIAWGVVFLQLRLQLAQRRQCTLRQPRRLPLPCPCRPLPHPTFQSWRPTLAQVARWPLPAEPRRSPAPIFFPLAPPSATLHTCCLPCLQVLPAQPRRPPALLLHSPLPRGLDHPPARLLCLRAPRAGHPARQGKRWRWVGFFGLVKKEGCEGASLACMHPSPPRAASQPASHSGLTCCCIAAPRAASPVRRSCKR